MLKTTAAGTPHTQTHVTILSKAGMLAALALKATPDGAVVASRDPRHDLPKRCEFKSPFAAVTSHTRALVTSLGNGWQIAYSGPPLKG